MRYSASIPRCVVWQWDGPPRAVVTHRQLLRMAWVPAYESETHLLRVNVSNLHCKNEKDSANPRHVSTEPGVGYRLKVA